MTGIAAELLSNNVSCMRELPIVDFWFRRDFWFLRPRSAVAFLRYARGWSDSMTDYKNERTYQSGDKSGVRWQSEAATPLWIVISENSLRLRDRSKAPSPLRSAGAL